MLEVAGATTRAGLRHLGTALARVLMAIGLTSASAAPPLLASSPFSCHPPVGPPPWIPAGLWLISRRARPRGIFLLAWGALRGVVGGQRAADLISRGSNLRSSSCCSACLRRVASVGVFLAVPALGFALVKEWA
jgi:hypothetical protein